MKDGIFLKKKAVAAAGLALVIVVGLCIGYFGKLNRFYEMTFLSNTFAACVALVGALSIIITGKDVPHFLYFTATMLYMVVVGICVTFAPGATLGGPGIMLHLINPMLALAFYLTFCDARGVNRAIVLTALALPFAYYIFMITFGRVTGGYIYPYFDPNRFGALALVLFGLLALVLIVAVGLLIMQLNRRVWTRREARSQTKEQ